MNIIVTGATSFLGLNLVKNLLKDNNKMFLILRKGSNSNKLIPNCDNVKIFYDINDLQNGVNYDACIHFAWGGVGSKGREDVNIQKENIEFSKKIFNACKKLKVKKFIFAGSQAEIGLKSEYGKAKYEVAKYCNENNDGINFIHLRIFSIYGEEDHETSLISEAVRKSMAKEKLLCTKCEHLWNYLYIDDFTNILTTIIYKINKTTQYDIASHTTIPLKDFILQITDNVSFGEKKANTEGEKDLVSNIDNLIKDIGDYKEISFQDGINKIKKHFSKRNKCIICNSDLSKNIFELKSAPNRAQKLSDKPNLSDTENLDLCICDNCSLLQLNNKEVSYSKEVIRSGGISTTMKNLRISQYTKLFNIIEKDEYFISKYKNNNKFTICECGSGKNEFLNVWKETDAFNKYNLNLIGFNYDKNLDFNFDIFTQFNFLEHQVEPLKMIEEIYNKLNDGGYGLVTVPSGEFIVSHSAYYELIIDHLAYYSINNLKSLFEKVGFNVISTDYVNTNKDTIEIIVKKEQNINSKINDEKNIKNDTSHFEISNEEYKLSIQKNLYNSYVNVNKSVNEFLTIVGNSELLAWGASHQGFTIINTTELRNKIKYVIDSADFKLNKYIPGSEIKIINKNELKITNAKYILILAPGYVEEITKEIRKLNDKIKIAYLKDEKIIL